MENAMIERDASTKRETAGAENASTSPLNAIVRLPFLEPYYRDEHCTIFNADCREVLPWLDGFDLMLTDPPYGIDLQNHAQGKERSNRSWSIAGDADQCVGECVLGLVLELPQVVFASPMRPWSGRWRQHLVWEKGEHVSGGGDPATCWKPSWELIQVRNTPALRGSRDGAVLRFQADKEDYKRHPSPKPLALIRYLLDKMDGVTSVVDPFMGSGTTLVAAKLEGLQAVGIEINEKYCEVAAERLRQGVLF